MKAALEFNWPIKDMGNVHVQALNGGEYPILQLNFGKPSVGKFLVNGISICGNVFIKAVPFTGSALEKLQNASGNVKPATLNIQSQLHREDKVGKEVPTAAQTVLEKLAEGLMNKVRGQADFLAKVEKKQRDNRVAELRTLIADKKTEIANAEEEIKKLTNL